MGAKAVIENTGLHGKALGQEALDISADFIKDFTFGAQSRQFCFEAAPSFAPKPSHG